MTESEKKEIERIQAKIMNTAAIILGCAGIIFVMWIYCIKGPDIDRSLREHAKYTTAYISGIAGRPGRVSVFLIYKHDGKIYKRGVGDYPRIETFSMKPPRAGDSCIVAYDSLNPRYCTIYKDFRREVLSRACSISEQARLFGNIFWWRLSDCDRDFQCLSPVGVRFRRCNPRGRTWPGLRWSLRSA